MKLMAIRKTGDDDGAEPEVIFMYVEKINGQYYAWEEETHSFLGQGLTRDGLFERVADNARIEGKAVFMVRLIENSA